MRKYDSYKDSGIEWIGEIPSHWEVKKVNYCFEQIGSGTTPTAGKPEFYENGEFNWLQTGDLNDNEIYETSKKITQEALNEYSTLKFYPENSLVIAMYGATIGKTGLLKIESTTNQACCVLSKPKGLNQRFAFYWLNYVKPHIISLSYGGGQPNINQEQIRSLKIQCPTFQEQTAIAAYLDRKTAEIDELIADKKRLLELYEEEKTAIINELVTGKKVWDGHAWTEPAEVKDSGIEWLGEIPEHWMTSRMKNICKVRQGLQIPIEKRYLSQIENSLEYITIRSINNPDQPKEYIENPPKNVVCCKDDILMARTGATGEPIINVEGVFHNNFFLVDYDRNKVERMFLYYFLKSGKIKEYLLLVAGTTTIPDLNHGAFYDAPFFEFSKDEQKFIVRHIETESARIDAKKAKTEKLIELLTEYRTALISEVVTGKIKVID